MFVAGMFLRHVGQRAIVTSVLCGLIVAVGCAWWSEIVWFLVRAHVAGPSPFLVTPLAATSTVLIAVVLGLLLPSHDPERATLYSWRAVVFGGPSVIE